MTLRDMDTRAVVKGVHTLGLDARHTMSRPLMALLSRGGKFIITPRTPQATMKSEREQAFKDYVRSVRLKIMFARKDSGKPFDPRYHVPNPSWQPPRAPAHVEARLDCLGVRLQEADAVLPVHRGNNCTLAEREALEKLCHNANIIVKPADKNLGLTLMAKDWYLAECQRQLGDTSTYRRVHNISVTGVQKKMLAFIEALRGEIPSHEYKWLKHETSRLDQLPQFYIMPKLHKNPVKGRPIVASHSWCTWPISKWIANRINSHTARQNTVLSDTNALIQLLEGVEFDEDADVLLSTADVESLYTSIPIKDALTAVGERLTHLGESRAFVRTTLAAVELVLKNNFFECNGITYQQIKGLAMGTPLAPPVANLFMANLEAKHEDIMPLIYKRFLDDIFVVQIVDEHHTGQGFWIAIHAMHPNIKLTRETSAHMVDFLDLQIYREGKRLLHRVHQKALNKYLYISPRSCHPAHVIKGFVRTELIRYARNSSTELDYNKICRAFSSRLRERGFHPCFLRHTFASVEFQHYAIRSAKERPMIYKALYTGSIASHTLRSVLQEWYETAPLDFKVVVPKPIVCHMVGKNIYNTLVRAKVPT